MSLKPLVDCFHDDIEAVVDKYRNEGITLSEVIGCLELIKMDIHRDNFQSDESPE